MRSELSRRNLLKLGLTSAGTAAAASTLTGGLTKAFASACGLTPPQTEGPFYPGLEKFTQDTDLSQVSGRRAKGQIIYLRGQVLDSRCNPVAGASVEIWQACATGKYNNPNDPNPAELDPNFRYWGEAITDGNGQYIFKTIIPGAYPADVGWTRPPHIHFRIARLGFHELTTQMYFKGEALNESDLIFQKIPSHERSNVVVDFQPVGVGFEPGALIGTFNITLNSVR